MPFLTKADLTPPLYPEIIDTITRGDDTMLDKAIANAVGEMKSYLSRYDVSAMFGVMLPRGGNVSGDGHEISNDPTFTDEHLKSLGKDITCWHLVKLANPNIDLQLFRTMYEDAVKYLNKVMKGDASPDWPPRAVDPITGADLSGQINYSSNTKRNNHY